MKKALLLLGSLVALRLLLMAVVPVFEPSEARYAAISANMARTGDFVVPAFTHDLEYQSFDGKPPLVFQAGGLCCRVLGVGPGAPGNAYALQFAVRLFPFVSAALLLWILFSTTRHFLGPERAALATWIAGTSTAFFAAAGMAMTDMTLALCTTGALLCYWRFLDGFALRHAAAVAALLGAGMIVKGPVSLVMFGLPALADAIINRRWRGIFNWKWLAVAPLYFAIAVPWFVLVEARNPGSVWYFFYNENFLRFVTHDYGDRYGAGREAFRGVSILWAIVATLPWSLLPLWGLVRKVRGALAARRFSLRRGEFAAFAERNALRGFPFLALAAITLFWCLTSRVLLYYLFPVIALFAAWAASVFAPKTLRRLLPFAVAATVFVTAGGLLAGMAWSDKMRGAATELHPLTNHYAYEFYHGTPPPERLARLKAQRERAIEAYRARKAAEKNSDAKSAEVRP